MSELLRLQKFFTDTGTLSRRSAEAEIAAGKVLVNGTVAKLGDKINPMQDVVIYGGKRILPRANKQHKYIMLNKPRGYLCATVDDRGRKCVTELVEEINERIYPVGRLDMISEGMLLLTNDGELKNRLTHPSHTIEKIYRVKVAGLVSDDQLETLCSPLVIDDYKIRPCVVTRGEADESGTVLKFILTEGRNRQIRKMCEIAGLTVKRLSRVSIGKLKLDGLPVGKWRYLDEDEVEYLYKATNNVSVRNK